MTGKIDFTLRAAPTRLTDWPGNKGRPFKRSQGSERNKTRPVRITTLDGEVLIFPSAVKAADYFGTEPQRICRLVRGGTSPSAGIFKVEKI